LTAVIRVVSVEFEHDKVEGIKEKMAEEKTNELVKEPAFKASSE
jgi:hypothetical protein